MYDHPHPLGGRYDSLLHKADAVVGTDGRPSCSLSTPKATSSRALQSAKSHKQSHGCHSKDNNLSEYGKNALHIGTGRVISDLHTLSQLGRSSTTLIDPKTSTAYHQSGPRSSMTGMVSSFPLRQRSSPVLGEMIMPNTNTS